MPDKFKNKYRIASIRLPYWDYSQNGWYFVTICAKNRVNYFGQIKNDQTQLNNLGAITHQSWLAIPEHFPFVILDEFIIMPNHLHGILIINHQAQMAAVSVETQNLASRYDGKRETQNLASLRRGEQKTAFGRTLNQTANKFGPQTRNLASIMRGFKIGVKKYTNVHNIKFEWQPRFYEHIIRDDESLNRIREYIKNNPANWLNDRNFQRSKMLLANTAAQTFLAPA